MPGAACPDHDSLQALIERVAALDRLVQEQFDARDTAASLIASQLDDFKRASNEWRGALNDLAASRLSVTEYRAHHAELEARLDALRLRFEDRGEAHAASDDRRFAEQAKTIEEIRSAVNEIRGRSQGVELSRVWIFAVLGGVVAVISVAIAFGHI